MAALNRHNLPLWLCLLLLAWAVLGVQLATPKVASGPFYAATEHHLGITRWEAAPRLGLDAWTTKFASGDTVGAKENANLPAATWRGSEPTPGILGVEPGSLSSKAIQNYYPSTKTGSIEFVFDTKTQTFVVGKPTDFRPGLSPHQQLVDSIKASGSTVVGGMFRHGKNGEFITN